MTYVRAAAMTAAALATAVALVGGGGTAQAADGGELMPYPGPDAVVWISEHTGSGGLVSSGLNAHLGTEITVACEGGGSVEVGFTSDATAGSAPVTFTLDCPAGAAAHRTVQLGEGLSGSFGVQVAASDPGIRWGLAVLQPE
ncbi:hypothetical protein OG723_05685 [Streptomyces sp. NBC_01278]|uniref:hypothetical protein n=1 Tax=unclassified Streptomyces TaxID=2593676 RepID=UPI002E1461B4|nr:MULTISPECIES: hypothetical protein [unclassified Streptomyces]WSR24520.1 hypothetical protein OG573_39230 [Streptomyces sp. NBC_01205]